MDLGNWIELAEGLWEQGLHVEVCGARDVLMAGQVSGDGGRVLALAKFLALTGDERARPLLLWLARNGRADMRYRAARELLDTDDRQTGVDTLVELSGADPWDMWTATDVARSLVQVGAEEHAVRLLVRMVEQTPADRWDRLAGAIELLCRIRPAQARRVLLVPEGSPLVDDPDSRVAAALRGLLAQGED
jgi:thioredoxin-like negative regulator of GroEL